MGAPQRNSSQSNNDILSKSKKENSLNGGSVLSINQNHLNTQNSSSLTQQKLNQKFGYVNYQVPNYDNLYNSLVEKRSHVQFMMEAIRSCLQVDSWNCEQPFQIILLLLLKKAIYYHHQFSDFVETMNQNMELTIEEV